MNKIINLIKLYWNRVQNKVEKYPITYDEVFNFLNKKEIDKQNIWLTDKYYLTCELETFCSLAPLIPIRFIKYQRERMDCDNFALMFLAFVKTLFPQFALGYCEVHTQQGNHALNFILYKKSSGNIGMTFIEPQTGKVSYFDYKIYRILM